MPTKKLGRPARGVTEPLNIKIAPELLRAIRELAEIRQQTLRVVVEELLRAGLTR